MLIKHHDGGTVFYRGRRVGLNGVPFDMLKFRTMVEDAEALGGPSTANDDRRLTPIGRTLRGAKLDELPQFLNVLRGEMSLVGPRPQVPQEVGRYTLEERELLTMPPGITDWASIRFRDEGSILTGLEDPDRGYEELIRPEKIELGLHYVRTASLMTDIMILLKTAAALAGFRPVLPVLTSTPQR